jgi:hypothetical protein
MPFSTKLFTATIFLKSGNTIVVRDIKTYSVEHNNGKPTSFDWKYKKPRYGDLFVDMTQVEAITILAQ